MESRAAWKQLARSQRWIYVLGISAGEEITGAETVETDSVSSAASATPRPSSRRIESAQRLVERWNITNLGMIGEKRDYIAAFAQHVFGESLQRFLGSDLNKDSRTRFVQRAQPFDELHGRCHLLRKNVQHLRHDPCPVG